MDFALPAKDWSLSSALSHLAKHVLKKADQKTGSKEFLLGMFAAKACRLKKLVALAMLLDTALGFTWFFHKKFLQRQKKQRKQVNPSHMHAATSITQASILFRQWSLTHGYPVGILWIWPTRLEIGTWTKKGFGGWVQQSNFFHTQCSPLATACCRHCSRQYEPAVCCTNTSLFRVWCLHLL